MAARQYGKLVVISGPSGVGKSTVVRDVLERCSDRLKLSVSATTRPPRPGERDGVDYYFLSQAEFDRRRIEGAFLECAEVFGRGFWYGTLWSEVRSSLSTGVWVILEVDVAGAANVLASFPDAITIFIRPDSAEELERRLRGRGTESEEAVRQRLAVAQREMLMAGQYAHQVSNISVDQAVDEVCDILRNRGLRYD